MTQDDAPVYPGRTPEMKRVVNNLIEQRNPGLKQTLFRLHTMMGNGNTANANIPFHHAEHRGTALEDINTVARAIARTSKGVRVLHKILAYGIEEYLADDRVVCMHCEEPIDGYRVTAKVTTVEHRWWHRTTGSSLCLDGETEAEPLREGRGEQAVVQVATEKPVPGGFSG